MSFLNLPHELQILVMDFYGDTSIPAHRRFSFVRAELKTVFMFSCFPERPRPTFARGIGRIKILKQFLQLTYLKSQCKSLLKNHRRTCIPYSFDPSARNFRSTSNHTGLGWISRLSSKIW